MNMEKLRTMIDREVEFIDASLEAGNAEPQDIPFFNGKISGLIHVIEMMDRE